GDEGEGTDEPDDAEEAAGLDCRAVEVIVPYAPGGGSDQQVRRLQSALEDALDTRLNIVYQSGGDGAIGWQAVSEAEPDGCTIANVVAPNIILLTETGEDVGFAADDFEYIAWTEYSPNIIGVANDSPFETIEDFIEEARERPGEVTVSGVGVPGRLLVSEVLNATDIDLGFVPVSGGVGDIVPQVVGGHIDAAISGFSLLDGGQIRPLALSGPERSEAYEDVPTFEEAGYDGVNLVTSWGLILPPETPEDIVETWNATVQEAMENDEVREAYAETGFITLSQTAEEAREYLEDQQEAVGTTMEGLDPAELEE
ncbi:MAG: hypothetical protein GEU81_14015, partial [Nitriliruptorales bacterium]|nr:hypothetical protein [Nitriliruptorales bacterium]